MLLQSSDIFGAPIQSESSIFLEQIFKDIESTKTRKQNLYCIALVKKLTNRDGREWDALDWNLLDGRDDRIALPRLEAVVDDEDGRTINWPKLFFSCQNNCC